MNDLAAKIRELSPDVVVLIARKMPRLAELFELDFGLGRIVLSDLAIPFSHKHFRGARVVIVDDLVNVGTTIQRAEEMVRACGATEVRLMAVGHRREMLIEQSDTDFGEPLSDETYSEIVDSLPQELHGLAKPYDLEFPIISCRLNSPYSEPSEVLKWLRHQYGEDAVHELTPSDHSRGTRITLDFGGVNGSSIAKFRFYFPGSGGHFNLAPIRIPESLSSHEGIDEGLPRVLLKRLIAVLETCPKEARLWDGASKGEANARALLFVTSLQFAVNHFSEFKAVFSPVSPDYCSVADGELLFGPMFGSWLSASAKSDFSDASSVETHFVVETNCDHRTFFSQPVGQRICSQVIDRGPTTVWGAFYDLFDVLGEVVGAGDPQAYALDWPFSKADVEARPYLRLRIGPTFADILRMLQQIEQALGLPTPDNRVVSAMLDFAIDSGFVVPTFAEYDGRFCRIYRKGESRYRDKVIKRVLYAWQNYGKPLSRTRFSKLLTVLSFSNDLKPEIWPDTIERGNVATFQSNCVDEERSELSQYIRAKGLLKRIGGADDAGTISAES